MALVDSHVVVVPLVDEAPHGYVMSYSLTRVDSGAIAGDDLDAPADREREVFHFKAISDSADPVEYSTLNAMLGRYTSGGLLRVYRMYPANLVAWDPDSNPAGYSDIVQMEAGNLSLPWYNHGMTRFAFDLDGVAVR